MMDNLIPLLTATPLAAGFLIPLANRLDARLSGLLAMLSLGGVLLCCLPLQGQTIVYHMGAWPTPTGIDLRVDALTTLLLLTINGLALLVGLCSLDWAGRFTSRYRYYSLLMFLVAGANGVVLAGDLFNLYVFMEIATIASYALVAFDGEDANFEASFKYAVLGGLSSSLILLGIGVLYGVTGTLNMAHLASRFSSGDMTAPMQFALALFFCGFGTKAAMVPFHTWLPDAYPSAPAPISALLSGVVSKVTGLYVLTRLVFNVFGVTEDVLLLMRWMGGITMVIGALLALRQSDIKRLFAWSSISQMGLILLAFGFGSTLAVVGALFHIVNHAVFKPLLFLNSGQIEAATGTRELRQMQGRARANRVAAVTCLAGSLSLAGIPPFNGFWSKLIIVMAAIETGHTGWAVLAVVMSIAALAYQLRVLKDAFYTSDESAGSQADVSAVEDAMAHETGGFRESILTTAPVLLLAIGCVALSGLVLTGLRHPVLIGPAADVLMKGPFAW